MRIVIPTYMREEEQVSFKWLHYRFKQDVTLCTDTTRVEYLRLCNPDAKVIDLGITDGIADTRQKLVDKFMGEKIFIVDDQVRFYQRTPAKRIINITESGIQDMLKKVEDALDDYAWVGISDRAGNNRVSDSWSEVQRSYSCYGINTQMFADNDISFDGLYKKTGAKNFEDFYCLLSMFTKGMKNVVLYDYSFYHQHGKKGGNSEFRNNKTHQWCYQMLQQEFPDFVKLKYKKNPNWTTEDGDNKRLESIISWKKAYESRQENTL